jgi:hypothetical protein
MPNWIWRVISGDYPDDIANASDDPKIKLNRSKLTKQAMQIMGRHLHAIISARQQKTSQHPAYIFKISWKYLRM